jgi:hypothetical protein
MKMTDASSFETRSQLLQLRMFSIVYNFAHMTDRGNSHAHHCSLLSSKWRAGQTISWFLRIRP